MVPDIPRKPGAGPVACSPGRMQEHEDSLQMARRHVREGTAIIHEQIGRIRWFRDRGFLYEAELSAGLLQSMREVRATWRRDLRMRESLTRGK